MSNFDFKAYPKIPRLEKAFRYSITEKLDGTNGIIHIVPIGNHGSAHVEALAAGAIATFAEDETGPGTAMFAGSRSRWLSPGKGTDNYGFAQWVKDNADCLHTLLEPGTHYGEWWGGGVQRNYGLDRKFFTLFNPFRYEHLPQFGKMRLDNGYSLLTTVPVLAHGTDPEALHLQLESCIYKIRQGSVAVPGFPNPEGLVVTIGNQNFKIICNEGDKSLSRDGA